MVHNLRKTIVLAGLAGVLALGALSDSAQARWHGGGWHGGGWHCGGSEASAPTTVPDDTGPGWTSVPRVRNMRHMLVGVVS